MSDRILQEVTVWAKSIDIPIIGVGWDQEEEKDGERHYRTRIDDRHLDWYFATEVSRHVPLLLTRIVSHRLKLEEERFMLDSLIHEIRNPLAVLTGHLELLDHEMAAHPRIEAIHRASDRIARRLDWASHQHGSVVHAQVSLRNLWSTIIQDLEPEWRPRDISWSYRGDEGTTVTDPWRVEQILFNLAKNAMEASADHGLIRADCYHLCDDLVFRVSNDGEPLSEEQRKKLFHPQASAKGRGHGLGLALSQRLARTLGGKVIYLPEKEGVSFMLML
ncbi:MAG: HAMP domain-containing histidine kinase [Firmicutes bacterium]|nr:HAMP domain-containing histidine kinase [Bacillota bacterium]